MRRLTGRVQHYAWGSKEAIPRIIGASPDGRPWAEYWLGSHSSAPSLLEDGTPLDAHLLAFPAEIGRTAAPHLPGRLPYLVKILSAAHSLSLQAHPSRAQAEAGFAAEDAAGIPLEAPERLFRDDWPKPEMIVAVTGFEALSGFRDPAESLALLAGLGPAPTLQQILRPLRTQAGPDAIGTILRTCLSGSRQARQAAGELVDAARRSATREDAVGDLAATAIELQADHPGDPSIIAALLMNRVILQPGQQIHQPAGTMHAYLRGTGIEIMANSDNVMRGGLTAKHVDIDGLLRIADLTPRPVRPSDPDPVSEGVGAYLTPYPEFQLWRITPDAGRTVALPGSGRGRILLVVAGALSCHCGERSLDVGAGQAVWLPAPEAVDVRAVDGATLAFLAAPGA